MTLKKRRAGTKPSRRVWAMLNLSWSKPARARGIRADAFDVARTHKP
jgi:hypothetical protein